MAGLRVWQTLKGQFVMGDESGKVHFLLRRQVTMPARPFLGASEGDKTELQRVVQTHLQNLWKR
jgi:phage gpG-like protein